jgi:thioredoxin-like negative regulator of GroEL
MNFKILRLLSTPVIAFFSLATTLCWGALPVAAQSNASDGNNTNSAVESSNSQPQGEAEVVSPSSGENIFSMASGEKLMEEAKTAISEENYDTAASKLQEARKLFNQLSNYYQELASSFSGIDNRIARSQRSLAADTAQMRDEATYRLALVYRSQNQPERAVPLLVQIIQSQQPTRELGKKAYQQLLEMGFVNEPYPRRSGSDDS